MDVQNISCYNETDLQNRNPGKEQEVGNDELCRRVIYPHV